MASPPADRFLQAFDCFRDPYSSKRRLSYDPSYSPRLQASPRAFVGESPAHHIIPALVRKLSQSAGAKRPRSSDGRGSSYNHASPQAGPGRQYGWSPRLSVEHPLPFPGRRSESTQGPLQTREQSEDTLFQPSRAGRRPSFTGGKAADHLRPDDDIRAALDAFSVKRTSLSHMPIQKPHFSAIPAGLASPVEERRMSFEVLRASIDGNASPRAVTHIEKPISALSRSQNASDRLDSPKGWFQRRGSSPLNVSHGPSASGDIAIDEPSPELMMSTKATLPPAPRPTPRRSLSASIVNLGKIVASMSSKASPRGKEGLSPGRPASSDSSSFKINHVYRATKEDAIDGAAISPRHVLSASTTLPSSPLVTNVPLVSDDVQAPTVLSPKKLQPSANTLSPVRPALRRQSKSDDNRTSPSKASAQSDLLSPAGIEKISKSASNSPMQSPDLESIEERGEAEDWLASLRGKPQVRRMSTADLFAIPSASRTQSPHRGSTSTSSVSGAASRTTSPHSSPIRELDALDFSKKPVPAISASQSATGSNGTARSRTTSKSSLLSASRPNTPAAAGGLRAFPAANSATSPSPGSRFLPHVHRHTQSSPALTLAAELASFSSPGPAGGEASVLNANHAKFVAVLTAAAAEAALRKQAKSPSNFAVKDKEEMRRLMRMGGIESAIEDDDEDADGSAGIASSSSGMIVSRLPKLSYDTSASSETDMSLSFVDGGRPLREAASSAPPAMTASRIKALSSGPVPKQPVFSRSGSNSPPSKPPSIISSDYHSPDVLGRDGLEHAWNNMRKREMQVSTDSQTSVFSDTTVNDGRDEDPFQPRVAVW